MNASPLLPSASRVVLRDPASGLLPTATWGEVLGRCAGGCHRIVRLDSGEVLRIETSRLMLAGEA